MPKAKELYLYSNVSDYSAQNIISAMEDNSDSDIVIRVNSPGGSVFSGWGIIAKMKEATGNITMKVDGWAASMAAFMLLFADDVEALESSKFILHRADMYVSTPEDQEFLDNVNKDLKTKMAKKLDFAKLKELKNVGIEDIFNPDARLDVMLTAKEAKQIGLINKITKLSVTEIEALENRFNIAATAEEVIHTPKNTIMTLADLKEKHPAVYAEAVKIGTDAGITAGVTKERNRVLAHIAFADVDLKQTIEGISKGEELSEEKKTEFATARITKGVLANIEKSNPEAIKTGKLTAEEITEKEKNTADFLGEALALCGIKSEK